MGVKTAFLNAPFHEEIVLSQPEGFVKKKISISFVSFWKLFLD